jgi:hypothetical protein
VDLQTGEDDVRAADGDLRVLLTLSSAAKGSATGPTRVRTLTVVSFPPTPIKQIRWIRNSNSVAPLAA